MIQVKNGKESVNSAGTSESGSLRFVAEANTIASIRHITIKIRIGTRQPPDDGSVTILSMARSGSDT